MVRDGEGDFAKHTNSISLCCTPEINIMWYVNYTLLKIIKFLKKKKCVKQSMLFSCSQLSKFPPITCKGQCDLITFPDLITDILSLAHPVLDSGLGSFWLQDLCTCCSLYLEHSSSLRFPCGWLLCSNRFPLTWHLLRKTSAHKI